MRILVLLTDGYGGNGGIAKFNRDLLEALCLYPDVELVSAIPRQGRVSKTPHPDKLDYAWKATEGTCAFLRQVLQARMAKRYDLVWCGHMNLLPAAYLAAIPGEAALLLSIYGIEAWAPHGSWFVRNLIARVRKVVCISQFTRGCFQKWSKLPEEKFSLVHCSVDLSSFAPGPKNSPLIARYRLQNRTVIMTLARFSSAERYKGIDEVLEILPDLIKEVPSLAYLVCGEGDDRSRLMAKAHSLGLSVFDWSSHLRPPIYDSRAPQVVFTGFICEQDKATHYRLSDAFVMPGRGEGFGIVYLEAISCGIPVVASKADASREIVRETKCGVAVDPKDPVDIRNGIIAALRCPSGSVPTGVDRFSVDRFRKRIHEILRTFCAPSKAAASSPFTG